MATDDFTAEELRVVRRWLSSEIDAHLERMRAHRDIDGWADVGNYLYSRAVLVQAQMQTVGGQSGEGDSDG